VPCLHRFSTDSLGAKPMPAFINRHPWNLIIGLAGFAVVLVAFAAATSWWLLVAPFALVAAVSLWRQTSRAYALVTCGFHSQQISKGRLRYEEMHGSRRRSLTLKLEYTEPGHQELFIPSEIIWLTRYRRGHNKGETRSRGASQKLGGQRMSISTISPHRLTRHSSGTR
jgi:hypothetical protein